jgi:hypothetical protein
MSFELSYVELCYAASYARFKGLDMSPSLQLMLQESRNAWWHALGRDMVTMTPWTPLDLTSASADLVASCRAAYAKWTEQTVRTHPWKPWWDYFLPDVIN